MLTCEKRNSDMGSIDKFNFPGGCCNIMIMKKFLVLVFLLIFPTLSFAQPAITFDKEQQDFGAISKSASLAYTFEFTNSGSEDLIINRVVPS